MLEGDGFVGVAHHAAAACGPAGDAPCERAVPHHGSDLTGGIDIAYEATKTGVAVEFAARIQQAADMAVFYGGGWGTVDERGDAGCVHVSAENTTRHLEVADGGTLKLDEGCAEVIDFLEAVGLGTATVKGQRVAIAVESTTEGTLFGTRTDTLGIDVSGHLEILATETMTRRHLAG